MRFSEKLCAICDTLGAISSRIMIKPKKVLQSQKILCIIYIDL